jgi:hypothetical protein
MRNAQPSHPFGKLIPGWAAVAAIAMATFGDMTFGDMGQR